ncbi:pyridoxamine 5'-phosphate oxidase family protein [Escherichia coli]|uniref:pyridoxamine 5'-phosphate oxidase family protein n=1 Tax=Escherichia coli TaxID=562 RepID=UPI00191A28BF|nr:pyridoxamine 5'-phosphate oxidase family protein [Escherichia coli]EGJ0178152.1 pyridoxamine 5'-phosphate oxidase family protein [Escherichia coli]EKK2775950.1 pyridoxamine 5'-phosphate oxidase family protein [Escherichia coli]CAD6080829.1 Predicted flavin-nucleotide-binding protein [Escherichia coli]CAD6545038.1 Predicted flavin-nucleotide-binding protein [Escherichia coli]
MSNPEYIVSNFSKIIKVIEMNKVCRIAINDQLSPYIVPVNFGYEIQNNQWVFWFHGARTGKKMKLIRKNPYVSIEIDCGHQLIEAEEACDYSYSYSSIIASGKAKIVQDYKEIKHGMDRIMQQVTTENGFNYREDMMKAVCVVRIECTTLTCRQHLPV